jgi:hypothetical protein
LIDKIKHLKNTAFILFDLKKAFDLINHDIPLKKLSIYGIRGIALDWLKSYLANRKQKTKLSNNNFSSFKPITAGVPQGSILGSLLFILFINDVFQFCTSNIEIILYADDTAIIIHANNDNELQLITNDFIELYLRWCDSNCIIVNPIKSCYLTFCSNLVIKVKDVVLSNPECVKYLGILIDNKLSWKHQVSHVTAVCAQRIGIFRRVMMYIPQSVRVMYYNAFIRSCYSYCLLYWFNNSRSGRHYLLNKIDHIIDKLACCAKITTDELIKKYRVFDVWKVHKLQSLSFMYDVCNNLIELPFVNIDRNTEIHSYNTRSNINVHIDCMTAIDKKNFLYYCIINWNACPLSVRLLTKQRFMHQCKMELDC